MWRDTTFLFRVELWRLLRVRETLVWTFVMPLLFIYFIGSISGGGSRDGYSYRGNESQGRAGKVGKKSAPGSGKSSRGAFVSMFCFYS